MRQEGGNASLRIHGGLSSRAGVGAMLRSDLGTRTVTALGLAEVNMDPCGVMCPDLATQESHRQSHASVGSAGPRGSPGWASGGQGRVLHSPRPGAGVCAESAGRPAVPGEGIFPTGEGSQDAGACVVFTQLHVLYILASNTVKVLPTKGIRKTVVWGKNPGVSP